MLLDELKKKKILILGFGREGRDTLLFLKKKFPKKTIGIADQKFDKDYLKTLKNYDIIIKSPGVPPYVIAPFITKNQKITSQTEIFFENCPGTIIGITGTKGKSTTASLVHAVLKQGGIKTHLIGNIEVPVLQFLHTATPEDVFVYELSSFQLTNLSLSPHIAVFLNLYPEHLDYYGGNFRSYANAKANITKHQSEEDFLIYNSKDPDVCKIAKSSKAQKLPFGKNLRSSPSQKEAELLYSWIASTEPAILIGKLFGIPEKKIQQAIRNFKPLPHRLEKVGEFKGVTFYNDSLATIPEATIAAIEALGPKVYTLIAGGYDRGISFEKLGKDIGKSSVRVLVLFPTTGKKILASIKNPPKHFFAKNMQEAVWFAYLHTAKGKICILSPAASSFNMFKDYKDRGEQFIKWVKKLGNEKNA
ncbi:MAG: hypothetical protein Greene071421_95 [Parcubacteria group bacterium Greene0714_21]|nr:MAG: hypothetical protein Greene041639_256 [Parcubacteria group bacterium Greene0416_39]TSC97785.1 MAG: hypothetical protein Greene101447_321 [Parcubacteria group bacterium Greene1014_47]TSD04259.1 MAG: hypothetical protein Greene071421_95 [Parcubacteria group bacterium Greene0714_21]